MKVLVCGDRNWTDKDVIKHALKQHLVLDDIVIQGGNGYRSDGRVAKTETDLEFCVRGADALAYQAAIELGFISLTYWADWNRYGLAAGPRRNQLMIRQKPRLLLAFHDNLEQSRGTIDSIKRALLAGIPSLVFESSGASKELWELMSLE